MGVGKTTIGKELSSKWGIPVYDTDTYIEKKTGKTINAIFAENGEAYFRDLEELALKEQPTSDAVITTGGGMILHEQNRIWMKENGLVVFLYAEIDEIVKRLEHDQGRPLLKKDKLNVIAHLYQERLPIYKESAHVQIDTTHKTISAIVDELSKCIIR